MRIVIDIPAKQFNLIMHGEFYKATDKDYTILMESFNCCTILPKGHGRLGDLDALREEISSWGMNDYEPLDFVDAIDDAPTIIVADVKGEEE